MSENPKLSRRIDEQITAAVEKSQAMQTKADEDFRKLRERHEAFTEFAQNLIAEAGYPLQTLASHFDNAKVRQSDDFQGFHAMCSFKHTPRFPASVELRFDITHDDEVRNIILTKNVSILPVFMDFEKTDRFVLDQTNGDRKAALQWIEDEIVSFVGTYLRIQFVDEYQGANLVTDPVANVRFSKNFAQGEATFRGHKYFFVSKETLKEFETEPAEYVNT